MYSEGQGEGVLMAVPAILKEFDPFVDFDGLWTTRLADDYLPDPRLPAAKYECIDGRLILSPTEAWGNSQGEIGLAALIRPAARAAGLYVSGPVNLTFHPGQWIEPDITVLHTKPANEFERKWVPIGFCTMAVEFLSPGNRRKDLVDRPELCATAGVPYFMRVELDLDLPRAAVTLLRLVDGAYTPLASGVSGHRFEAKEPFVMGFDPAELLP
jgi:Uma2 family endonuclease